jgi:hypothetical protein
MIPPTTSLPNDDPKDDWCSRSHSVQGYHHPHDIEGDRAAPLQQLSRPKRFYCDELHSQNYRVHDKIACGQACCCVSLVMESCKNRRSSEPLVVGAIDGSRAVLYLYCRTVVVDQVSQVECGSG